jgi:E3 ubiquitin-protein ligase HUWE1
MLKHNFKVRFNDENGIDMGGISREFFHLLIQELVNPEYALFKTTNGLYRPSPYSSVNPSHLQYFELCGKVLARMIYDDYQTEVRFTPAVYKYLLGQESTLDDLKIEDPTLYKGLMSIACCDNEESLNQLAMDFTTTHSHFGSLETVELERGGKEKRVTLHNKDEFLRKFCQFHVNGCIERQLVNMRTGFNTIIPHDIVCCYLYWHDLEMILCGQSSIDISFMKSCTGYNGYTAESQVVVWLWQALESFSEKEWCQYIQFITGSPRLPLAESGQWKMEIKRGPPDESLLPTASTCFNSLSLPCYTELAILKKKLMQAIAYDHLTFLNH